MATQAISDRYVTADFRQSPLIALAELMGLRRYIPEISAAPELYAPILTGITVFRHLGPADRQRINSEVINSVPRGPLTSRLRMLIANQSVQPYWYMWSLSDQELRDFFTYNARTHSFTKHFDPMQLPDLSVTAIAGGIYAMSREGPRAVVSNALTVLKQSELVAEISRRLGWGTKFAGVLGVVSIPSLLVISGLNVMAKNSSERAKRELAARGLLAYDEL